MALSDIAKTVYQSNQDNYNRGQNLQENLRRQDESALKNAVYSQSLQSGKMDMKNAIQDRMIKAYSMFNDMIGGISTLKDPEQYKQALDFAYGTPIAQIVDPKREQYDFFSNQNNIKAIAPALAGYSALVKRGADAKELALEASKTIALIEDYKSKAVKREADIENDKNRLEYDNSKFTYDQDQDQIQNQISQDRLDLDKASQEYKTKTDERKREQNFTKARSYIEDYEAKRNNILSTVQRAMALVNPLAASSGSSILANLGGTEATDLRSLLETIKANLTIAELQKMRQNSPTGGAMGNSSDKDIELLGAVTQSIKPEQSVNQLKENLARIALQVNDAFTRQKQYYQSDYSDFIEKNMNPEAQAVTQPQATNGQIKFIGFE